MIVDLDADIPRRPQPGGVRPRVAAALLAASIVAVVASALPEGVPSADARLALPPGVAGVHLSAIPDRLLNDPPDARFRLPVPVRGAVGLGSVEGPPAVAWSEGGFWYELSSPVHTVAQLAELAGALR